MNDRLAYHYALYLNMVGQTGNYYFREDGSGYVLERLDASSRLAYGLCKKYGIETKGMSPREAWEALEEKTGKTPKDFYAQSGNAGADKVRFNTASQKSFTKALNEAIRNQSQKDAWRVTPLNLSTIRSEHPNAKLHVTDGGSTIAVDDGDIVAVCKNPTDDINGKNIIKLAVDNGGKKLDSFSGNHGFYTKCGFEPVSWCKFDEQYAPKGWIKGVNEAEPIIFYKYTGKKSKYKDVDEFLSSVKASKDYDTARLVRNEEIN